MLLRTVTKGARYAQRHAQRRAFTAVTSSASPSLTSPTSTTSATTSAFPRRPPHASAAFARRLMSGDTAGEQAAKVAAALAEDPSRSVAEIAKMCAVSDVEAAAWMKLEMIESGSAAPANASIRPEAKVPPAIMNTFKRARGGTETRSKSYPMFKVLQDLEVHRPSADAAGEDVEGEGGEGGGDANSKRAVSSRKSKLRQPVTTHDNARWRYNCIDISQNGARIL